MWGGCESHFLTLITSFAGSCLNIPELSRNRTIPETALGRPSPHKQEVSEMIPTLFPLQGKNVMGQGRCLFRALFLVSA